LQTLVTFSTITKVNVFVALTQRSENTPPQTRYTLHTSA